MINDPSPRRQSKPPRTHRTLCTGGGGAAAAGPRGVTAVKTAVKITRCNEIASKVVSVVPGTSVGAREAASNLRLTAVHEHFAENTVLRFFVVCFFHLCARNVTSNLLYANQKYLSSMQRITRVISITLDSPHPAPPAAGQKPT